MKLFWPQKDPDDVKDYAVDWAVWLGADTIASSAWIVPAGLTKNSDSHTATLATIWLAGGTAGASYAVTNRITTAGGRTADQSVTLYVGNN